MLEETAKISTYFEWLVIGAAFTSLIISILAFLFVISARKRAKRAEEMVIEIVNAVNKISEDAQEASESAVRSASAASESAGAAKNSAKSAEILASSVRQANEFLTGLINERKMLDKTSEK